MSQLKTRKNVRITCTCTTKSGSIAAHSVRPWQRRPTSTAAAGIPAARAKQLIFIVRDFWIISFETEGEIPSLEASAGFSDSFKLEFV